MPLISPTAAYRYDTSREGSDGTIFTRPGKCRYGIQSQFEPGGRGHKQAVAGTQADQAGDICPQYKTDYGAHRRSQVTPGYAHRRTA